MMRQEFYRPIGRFGCRLGIVLINVILSLSIVPGFRNFSIACAADQQTVVETIETATSAESHSPFAFADVNAKAQSLADTPYVAYTAQIPDFLCSLTREQWLGLLYDDDSDIWHSPDTPLHPELLIPGFIFTQPVSIHGIGDAHVQNIPFQAQKVQNKELAEKLAGAEFDFAGIKIHTDGTENAASLVGLMSASHFQFAGRNARLGVFALPLALNTAVPSREAYPVFREYWIKKKDDIEGGLIIYALMDSPEMAGAFEFAIIPGTSIIADVQAVFHPRRNAKIPAKIGIAPITGMFLFSETEGNPTDYRSEVHNCDGLLSAAADGGWQWSPLKNPQRLAIRDIALNSPRGFGLLQRDDNFDHYQDLHNRFERSTSVWVEPEGDWGPGRLELVELPGTRDFHSNITAYWIPEPRDESVPREPGVGETPADTSRTFKYRLYWMPPGLPMHELGFVRDTRMERSSENKTVTFYIDFAGGELDAIPADTGLTSMVELPKEATLLEKNLIKNEVAGGWRLMLKLSLPESGMLESLLSSRSGPPQLSLSAFLKKGENLNEPLTETWRYTIIL